MDNLTQKIDDLTTCSTKLEEEINKIVQSLKDFNTKTLTNVTKPPSASTSYAVDAVKAIKEFSDRERCKCNVVLYNLVEPVTSCTDTEVFTQLCQKGLGLNIKPIRTLRLGRPVENKIRPLLVILANAEDKLTILKSASRLRSHSEFKNVFISPDRTRQEREAFRKLKRRRAAGEPNLIIRNDKIITKHPTLDSSQNSPGRRQDS